MADTEILDMPVELCLEFMPVIGTDFLDAKWELVDDVVDKIDGVRLGVFCVDLKGAGCIVDCRVLEAANFLAFLSNESQELHIHLNVVARRCGQI